MSKHIFHITTRTAFEDAMLTGLYRPDTFTIDGFIHCSYAEQVASVAYRFYKGAPDLVLLEIDQQQLVDPVVDENLEGGTELFPHLYGMLPVGTILNVYAFQYDDVRDQWSLPEGFD